MQPTDELRSERLASLMTPHELLTELPLTPDIADTVIASRARIERIFPGKTAVCW
ncbi:hypothetical protein W909_11780 [Dickeya zeae EC1]|nr:hypothetical protein W909_11780 [Dickeya zeae EC1]